MCGNEKGKHKITCKNENMEKKNCVLLPKGRIILVEVNNCKNT